MQCFGPKLAVRIIFYVFVPGVIPGSFSIFDRHGGGVIGCQAAEGFLAAPEGHAPDGHFQAPGFDDGPGLHEGGAAVPVHPGGQLVAQGHHFGFQSAVGHG
jgi:hypothetical protein